jgi:TatD DNase family protein
LPPLARPACARGPTRDADRDCKRIREEEVAKGPFRAVLHCHILTFKKSETLRGLAAELPADRVMIKTGAP